jgi:YidC/Oxa1 family membrane protein insertase
MDNYRLILIFALAAVLFLIYQAWDKEHGPARQPPIEQPAAGRTDTPVPEGVPSVAAATDTATPVTSPELSTADTAPSLAPITVETDTLRLEINPKGGTLASAWLKHYAVGPDQPDEPFRLLKPQPPNMFIAQSGLLSAVAGQVPTQDALFTTPQRHYELGDKDQLLVELHWQDEPSGIQVIKRYRIERGSYVIQFSQEVINGGRETIAVRGYNQLQRTELATQEKFINTFTGGVYYSTEDKYKRVSFSDMSGHKLDRQVTDGWIAMIQHYFMSAWIPPAGQQQTFYTNVVDNGRYIIGMYSPALAIPPGASHVFEDRLFVGPKLQDDLAAIAPGLDLAVDYGWLTILAQPLYWVLSKIHSLVGNWGWSIIILTILIKLLFYKLSETSYRSMAGMRQLAPRLQALKDRYGDDKERLNQAMMEMYKKEKINPLGGCLPILIQIPVFIALYWVLLESVEMRQAPFMFWLNNLSAPDPYYVLPLLMGVSMFVQTKLNPQPPDPIQAKVMLSLPFVFTVFFAFFPSGLVLYYTVNNILSIAQQWYITRKFEQQGAKK